MAEHSKIEWTDAMTAPMSISELFAEIAGWAQRHGAINIGAMDSSWRGETDEWLVEINGQKDEVDGIPPFSARLRHKTLVQFAVVGPGSDALIGASEDDLIAHFRAAPWPMLTT